MFKALLPPERSKAHQGTPGPVAGRGGWPSTSGCGWGRAPQRRACLRGKAPQASVLGERDRGRKEKHCWQWVSVTSGIIYKTSSHTSPWDQVGCLKGGLAAPRIEKQRSLSWSAWRRASSLLSRWILHQRFVQVHFATEDTCAEQHDCLQSRRVSFGVFGAEFVLQCPSCSGVWGGCNFLSMAALHSHFSCFNVRNAACCWIENLFLYVMEVLGNCGLVLGSSDTLFPVHSEVRKFCICNCQECALADECHRSLKARSHSGPIKLYWSARPDYHFI